MRLVTFAEVGLPPKSNDRVVWRFVQEQQMILLTDNRSHTGDDSLERTIEEESTPTALPVLTVGSLERIVERAYREDCVARLTEIVLDLDNFLGAGRLFIP